eukprot:TRINITY_DN123221_c0_g1_i1.p1 TRINITY_DN123221_c0_g1~~TRINITY_DN123221_c0_g1_i1.p1  ORF type:complete len:458 (+),score=83.16 TRINITY_DN123221_c0_g1_i1:89-1462(+)
MTSGVVQFASALLDLNHADPYRHPFWEFKWHEVFSSEVLVCSVFLYLSGILCAAAGIGGGGVYVAVLMVFGRLSPYNAVPLSKAVVFFGSISSLVVNLGRLNAKNSPRRNVIDLHAVRTVVPAALAGTFLGVLVNPYTDDRLIVVILTGLLILMTSMVLLQAWRQRQEEQALEVQMRATPGSQGQRPDNSLPAASESESGQSSVGSYGGTGPAPVARKKPELGALSANDVGMSLLMLALVILGGVLRFHMHACSLEKQGGPAGACAHPIMMAFFGTRLGHWMETPRLGFALEFVTFCMPIALCACLAWHYGRLAMTAGEWSVGKVAEYQMVAVVTGILAGLVGVGGGLILSPFFLIMGMDPSVAVGTSSTCVLFTSSSTTLQYIFTDRIIMHLAVTYGLVTLLASYSGTSLVHVLQDKFSVRYRSYITLIVAAGVGLSAVLSIVKFCRLLQERAVTV